MNNYSNASAPPPSYDEVFRNSSDITDHTTTTIDSQPHSQVPSGSDILQQQQQLIRNAFESPPEPEPQRDPHVIVIQGGPLTLGSQPTRVQCPVCNKSTLTRIEYQNSCYTHAIAGFLCLMGCCCLAPVPYCVDNTKNAQHYCRKCSSHIATDFNGGSLCGFN